MDTSSENPKIRSEILRSSSLFLKEFEATEELNIHERRLLSGTRIKAIISPLLYWAIQNTPKSLALLPARLLVFVLRLLYVWPNNPFRLACEYICVLAGNAGYAHSSKQVYMRSAKNILGTIEGYFDLYRSGIDSVLDNIEVNPQDAARINALAEQHGGVILMVPHNFAAVFSALKMNRMFKLLIVTRNSPTIDRTKAALDFFERMHVTVLMVRGGNPFELSRTLFSELKKGTVVAATVDSIVHDSPNTVRFFGQEVGFASWAAKIGVKKKIPIVPTYFRSHGKQVISVYGEEIITGDVDEAMQHYAGFFEQQIFEDPASWAYLGDKRWRKVLQKASGER